MTADAHNRQRMRRREEREPDYIENRRTCVCFHFDARGQRENAPFFLFGVDRWNPERKIEREGERERERERESKEVEN